MTIKRKFLTFVFMAGAVLAGSQARAGFLVHADYSGSSSAYTKYEAQFTLALQAAADEWSKYVATQSVTLDINVDLGASGVATANAGSLYNAFQSNSGGVSTYELGPIAYLTTGVNPNPSPSKGDAVLNVGTSWMSYFAKFFDQGASALPSIVDPNFILMHELGHILGFTSFRQSDGNLMSGAPGAQRTTFDALTQKGADGVWYFVGAAAKTAYHGAPVPLTTGNYSHLGNDVSTWDTDVMNGVRSLVGHKYALSGVDVGVLADLGYDLTAAGKTLVYGQGPPAAPEPASIVALALGVLGVGGWRAATRRRRAA